MNVVLIVDDDTWTRQALGRIFQYRGWDVRTASTVAEGLESLALEPNCVILDLSLPDGDGTVLLRTIRARGLSTRVVICTVRADAESRAPIASLRPDAVIPKPVEVSDLIDACRGSAPVGACRGRC
jgi:DNA-binding response OmpR family regulator